MFKSVTQIGQAGTYLDPQSTPPGQSVALSLHGSSGGGTFAAPLGYGTWFEAICDTTMAQLDNAHFKFYVYNPAGYNNPNSQLTIGPIDAEPRSPWDMVSHWFGYVPLGSVMAHPFTWRKLDALYEWFFATYPQASRTKVSIGGNSMGGWGTIQYGMRHPERFAACWGMQSAWRRQECPDWGSGYGSLPASTYVQEESKTFGALMDMVAYVSDLSRQLPFFCGTINTEDFFAPWSDYKAGIAAMRARNRSPQITNKTRSGFVFGWMPGPHGGGAGPQQELILEIEKYYVQRGFEIGVGYPVFDNSSRDADPETAPAGYINLGFKWRNVVESPTSWSCEISNALGATTVSVLPRSDIYLGTDAPIVVTIPAGQWIPVTFSGGTPPPPPPPPPPGDLATALAKIAAAIAILSA